MDPREPELFTRSASLANARQAITAETAHGPEVCGASQGDPGAVSILSANKI